MNVKGVSVVTSVALVIVTVVFLSNNSAFPPPEIIDYIEVTDNVSIIMDQKVNGIQIKDNGMMNFVINVLDTPTFSDALFTG